MTVYKTVLAPNAPWPEVKPKMPKVPKVRSKPSGTDAKFEAWLKTIEPVSRRERIKK
jgi:hypothetical protein